MVTTLSSHESFQCDANVTINVTGWSKRHTGFRSNTKKLTKVVTLLVLSRYSTGAPTTAPAHEDERIYIETQKKPLYDLDEVRQIAARHDRITLWTRKCITKVQELRASAAETYESSEHFVQELIDDLKTNGKYLKSEWCFNGSKAFVASDSYKLVRREYVRATDKYMAFEYYLKISISTQGNIVFVVSCKPSGS